MRFIRLPEVIEKTGLVRSTIYEWLMAHSRGKYRSAPER